MAKESGRTRVETATQQQRQLQASAADGIIALLDGPAHPSTKRARVAALVDQIVQASVLAVKIEFMKGSK